MTRVGNSSFVSSSMFPDDFGGGIEGGRPENQGEGEGEIDDFGHLHSS
jgi:hypothetical protein